MFTIYTLKNDGDLHFSGTAPTPEAAVKAAGALVLYVQETDGDALDVLVTSPRLRQMPFVAWRASDTGLLPGQVRPARVAA